MRLRYPSAEPLIKECGFPAVPGDIGDESTDILHQLYGLITPRVNILLLLY